MTARRYRVYSVALPHKLLKKESKDSGARVGAHEPQNNHNILQPSRTFWDIMEILFNCLWAVAAPAVGAGQWRLMSETSESLQCTLHRDVPHILIKEHVNETAENIHIEVKLFSFNVKEEKKSMLWKTTALYSPDSTDVWSGYPTYSSHTHQLLQFLEVLVQFVTKLNLYP